MRNITLEPSLSLQYMTLNYCVKNLFAHFEFWYKRMESYSKPFFKNIIMINFSQKLLYLLWVLMCNIMKRSGLVVIAVNIRYFDGKKKKSQPWNPDISVHCLFSFVFHSLLFFHSRLLSFTPRIPFSPRPNRIPARPLSLHLNLSLLSPLLSTRLATFWRRA